MTPFLFLRLPLLVNRETLDYMSLLEQLQLSTTNEKARLLVKRYLAPRHRFPYLLSIKNSPNLLLELENKKGEGLTFNSTLDNVALLIEQLAGVFNIPQVFLDLHETPHLLCKNIMRSISKMKLRVDKMKVVSNGTDDELYRVVLDECRNVSNLFVDCEISSSFVYTNNHDEPFKWESLRIKHVTARRQPVDLYMDCKNVIVSDCGYLTSDELKTFITRWIQSCKIQDSKQYIQLPYNGYVFSSIFANTSAISINQVEIYGSTQHFCKGECFLIRSTTGKEAVVYHEERERCFVLTTNFKNAINDE